MARCIQFYYLLILSRAYHFFALIFTHFDRAFFSHLIFNEIVHSPYCVPPFPMFSYLFPITHLDPLVTLVAADFFWVIARVKMGKHLLPTQAARVKVGK